MALAATASSALTSGAQEGPGHMLRLAHAYGVYPAPLQDAVISLGDDAFAFVVGRQVAICDQVRHKMSFLTRDAKNRTITALARSLSGKLLAVAERVGGDEGQVQISILPLPKLDANPDGSGGAKASEEVKEEEALKVLHPKKAKLDITGLAFTADARNLVSMSCLPDSTITYWRWEIDKPIASHDIKLEVTRIQVNPKNGNEISVSGPNYLRLWEYNPNDQQLKEHPSMLPLKQERSTNYVDHCWVLGGFLCAATEEGHVHIFEDGEHRRDVDVRAVILKDEANGPKAKERQEAKELAKMMGTDVPGAAIDEDPLVSLTSVAPWGRGFVVGGDHGYLGVFKLDAARLTEESFGTFRMPKEEGTIFHMSAGSDDTFLTILSWKDRVDVEDPLGANVKSQQSTRRESMGSRTKGLPSEPSMESSTSKGGASSQMEGREWSLCTFPVGQADLAATGQLDVFIPVFPLDTHHGGISAMSVAQNRRVVATTASDMHLKVWGYPSEEAMGQANAFTSELSIAASTYDTPKALAMHPLGFQVAVILEDTLRIYHLTNQQTVRTLFDLPLKHPGHVTYSRGGNMLAVTSDNDVCLLDPWKGVLIHMFSGRSGHLTPVKQVLFSDDDRLLVTSGAAPHGAIYGWTLEHFEEKNKEKAFEHVSKGSDYCSIAYDSRRQLVVALAKPEGLLRVIGHRLNDNVLELTPQGRGGSYTALALAAPLGMLFAGTEQGAVRVFNWPLAEGGAGANPYMEVSLHAHAISAMALSGNARMLFTGCEGGAVMACEVEMGSETVAKRTAFQLNDSYTKYRYKTDTRRMANREDEKKMTDVQNKLVAAGQGVSVNNASLDELVLVPKQLFQEYLSEIKELEERMQSQRQENEYTLEQRELEMNEKLMHINTERTMEKQQAEEKYDNLFMQLKKTNESNTEEMKQANHQFDLRTRKFQDEFESSISKEYDKQNGLLNELQHLRDQQDKKVKLLEEQHEEQLQELRGTQEKAIREWRADYDKVCSLLKSDGLKFEEALRQQESEYEGQIGEILEHKRVALQVESEKSTTALKDGVSMKQTISMLQGQLREKQEELVLASRERDDLRKKLETSLEAANLLKDQLKERERGLKVKDDSLAKIREQMKHLESFRFVLFHKVRALEEERDPLEEQVSSLKTSVREMYSEFVREFRQKQKLDQQLSEKTTLSGFLQNENVELRAKITQLKKDARRLLGDVEQVLHAETTAEFERMPKKLQEVVERHKGLSQWAPTAEERERAAVMASGGGGGAEGKDAAAMVEEMLIQRDLLFRKNQIAVASACQTKRECGQDFRRLTSENAALIAEMNTLRSENRSFKRSCKELEASVMSLKAKVQSPGPHQEGAAMARTESAPAGIEPAGVGGAPGRRSKPGPGSGETPYMKRKVLDQQDVHRRQQTKGRNQLPPVAADPGGVGAITGARGKATIQEQRFSQSLENVQAGRRQMERQGFDIGSLTAAQAQPATASPPAA